MLTLIQTFTAESGAVRSLIAAYTDATVAASKFALANPAMMLPGRGKVAGKFAKGKPYVVGGSGTRDSEPAMLAPGETVIPAKMSKRYGKLINGMIAGNIPGYNAGKRSLTEDDSSFIASMRSVARPGSEANVEAFLRKELERMPETIVAEFKSLVSTISQEIKLSESALKPKLKELRSQYLSQMNQQNELQFSHIGEGRKITAGNLNASGAIAGDAKTQERLDYFIEKVGPDVVLDVKNGFAADITGFLNDAMGGSGASLETVIEDSIVSGTDKWRKSIEIGGGTFENLGEDLERFDSRFNQNLQAAYDRGGRIIVDTQAQVEKLRLSAIAKGKTFDDRIYVTLDALTDETLQNVGVLRQGLDRVFEEARQTITEPRYNSLTDEQAAALGPKFMGRASKDGRITPGGTGSRRRFRGAGDFRNIPENLFYNEGAQDARGYTSQVEANTQDIYVTSRDRTSPHELAPKDGRDDAIAYDKAREEALAKKRRRRVSQSKQGPAPIGPVAPAGATILPIVPQPTERDRKRTAIRDKIKSIPSKIAEPIGRRMSPISQRMNSMGGGMGLLGANMGLSMLPNFAGKGIIQGGLGAANIGMMFGPMGMALGAAIGVATAAVTTLIGKYKDLQDVAAATFKSSTELATFFGNTVVDTTLKVGGFSSSITGTKEASDDLGQSFGYTNEELAKFVELIGSLPEDNPLKEIVDSLTKEDNPEKINKLAKAFITTQVALGQLKPEQAQKTLDLLLAGSDNLNMVGSSFINISSQAQAISETLKSAATNSIFLGDSLLQLLGVASNTTSLEKIREIIKGIGLAGLDSKKALDALALALAKVSAPEEVQNALRILRSVKGITDDQVIELMTAAQQGVQINTEGKTLEEILAKARKDLDKINLGGDKGPSDYTQTKAYKESQAESNGIKSQIELLKQKKKVIDDQIKQQEKITNEIQRQNDYLDKQRSIDKEIVEAKIRGDYLSAANLLQQKTQNTVEFNQEEEKSKLQERADALQKQIDALQIENDKIISAIQKSSMDNSSVTNGSANRIIAAITKGSITGPVSDEFRPPINDPKQTSGAAGKTTIGKTREERREYYDSSGQKVTRDVYQNLPVAPAQDKESSQQIFIVPFEELRDRTFTDREALRRAFYKASGGKGSYDAPDGFTYQASGAVLKDGERIGQWYAALPAMPGDRPGDAPGVARTKVKAYSGGGGVRGAGTAKSDSIPAMLSNGEYVIQADSVSKYGQGLFDSLNAQKFANGGRVKGYAQGGMPNVTGMGLDWLGKTLFKSGNSVIKNLLGFDATTPMNKKSGMEKLSMASMLIPGSSAAKTGMKAAKLADPKVMKYFLKRGSDGDILGIDDIIAVRGSGNDKVIDAFTQLVHDPIEGSQLFNIGNAGSIKTTRDLLAISLMRGANVSGINKAGIGFGASPDRSIYAEQLVETLRKRGLGKVLNLPAREASSVGSTKAEADSWMFQALNKLNNKKDIFDGSVEIPGPALDTARSALSGLLKSGYDKKIFAEYLKTFNQQAGMKKGFAMGGLVNLPKFHDWNGPVPGTYGQELPAMLKSGTEGIYQEGYMNDLKQAASNTTNSANSVYNVSMTIDGGNSSPKEIAQEVMKQMQVLTNKNNKTNVGLR
jgi:hypothetical protein